MTKLSSAQLKARARGILLGRYGIPMGAMVLLNMGMLAVEFFLGFFIPTNSSGSLIYSVVMLIVSVFTALFETGYSYLMLNMARQKKYSLQDLLFVFHTMPDHAILLTVRVFFLALACMIPFIAGVVLMVVFQEVLAFRVVFVVLFIISMVLVLRVALLYSQIFLLYLDNPYLACGEIMRQSKALMKGNCLRFFYLNLSFFGLSLLGILSFGVGLLWITPYITMTQVEFYRNLINEN